MNIVDIIANKRDGNGLTGDEIRFFVRAVVTGEAPDYQLAAWLMAVFLRGLSNRETLDLTLAMRDSGRVLAWPAERSRASMAPTACSSGVRSMVTSAVPPS